MPTEAMAEGIRAVRWPGRLQLLGPGPLTARLPGRRVWLDGGHNRGGAMAISAEMARHAPFDLIFALTRTRWIRDVLGPFAPLVRKAHTIPLYGHPHHDRTDGHPLGNRDAANGHADQHRHGNINGNSHSHGDPVADHGRG